MAEHNQQFDSMTEWECKGRSWLTRRLKTNSSGHPYNHAVCFDMKGRLVKCGGDFMRARDDGSFPVRWLWPDQIAEIGNQHPLFEQAVSTLDKHATEFFEALRKINRLNDHPGYFNSEIQKVLDSVIDTRDIVFPQKAAGHG